MEGIMNKKINIKLLLTFFAIFSFSVMWLSLGGVAGAETVFTTNTLIDAGNTAYDGQDIVVINCTLTVNGPHSFNSLQVVNNAVVTHQATTASQEYSLLLTVASNLIVDATSKIDVSGRGYLQGRTLGNTTVGAATLVAGGSYGGLGGFGWNGSTTNAVYGDYQNPNELGSGGGPHSNLGVLVAG